MGTRDTVRSLLLSPFLRELPKFGAGEKSRGKMSVGFARQAQEQQLLQHLTQGSRILTPTLQHSQGLP